MEDLNNRVISRQYVEKNYVHKDQIREIIEKVADIADTKGYKEGFLAYLGKLNYLLIYGKVRND